MSFILSCDSAAAYVDDSVLSIFSGCHCSNLELSTGRHHLSSHVAVLQASLENVFTTVYNNLVVASVTSATLKNH